jgi:orotate phosphoribosyltransferase
VGGTPLAIRAVCRPHFNAGVDDAGVDGSERKRLAALVRKLCVVHGEFVLSSGDRASYYIDLRRATLHHDAAPLIGHALLALTADWSYHAVGGLTLGADPVAAAMLHAAAASPGSPEIDAFVVRKVAKPHGMQRRIEGPDVAGRRVLVVEDTSTTGSSVLAAVDALRAGGAEVAGVATVVDRAAGAEQAIVAAGLPYRSVFTLTDLGL